MRNFVKVGLTACFLYAISAQGAEPERVSPPESVIALTRSWPLQRTPPLDAAAQAHLGELLRDPDRARLHRVRKVLARFGESASRVRPFAVLGSPGSPAALELLENAARVARTDAFTHFGVAARAGGLVILLTRQALGLGPLTPTANGYRIRLRASARARISAWLLGPCPRRDPVDCRALPTEVDVFKDGERSWFVDFPTKGGGYWTLEVMADVGLGPEVAFLRHGLPAHPTRRASGNRRSVGAPTAHRQKSDGPADWLMALRHSAERAGLDPHPALERAASAQASEVCRLGWALHIGAEGSTPDDRARAEGFRGRVVESVGVAVSARRAWREQLRSPAHRAGLLDPMATHRGVALARSGDLRCLVVVLGRAPNYP